MDGGSGSNTLNGDFGNDLLLDGGGDDTFFGGAGTDELSYANAGAGVVIDRSAGTATGNGADSIGTDI
ncbi:MAG: hypothetical protein FJX02_11515 [Alphaproteobacteria bacterium]|nr:hypothetical protein [Alphaproteobacteria bacterium]